MSMTAALTNDRTHSRDNEVIRVDFTCDHMGIAAALRQAFAAAANERSAYDFDELLSQLN